MKLFLLLSFFKKTRNMRHQNSKVVTFWLWQHKQILFLNTKKKCIFYVEEMYPEAAIKIANLTFKIDSMLCWILKFHILCSLWEVRLYKKKMSEIMITQKWFYLAIFLLFWIFFHMEYWIKMKVKRCSYHNLKTSYGNFFYFRCIPNNINFKLMK